MTLVLRYSARSDRGLVRQNNQDAVYAGPRLLALADGMGGHAAGEVASSLVISALAPLDDDDPGDDLLRELHAATVEGNAAIHRHVLETPDLEGMGTTLTAILFKGSRLGLVHVGDSRAYQLRDGSFTQITKDDTFVQSLIDEGRITEEEAHTHPQRSLLLRAITGQDVEPSLTVREARPGDRYLLCSRRAVRRGQRRDPGHHAADVRGPAGVRGPADRPRAARRRPGQHHLHRRGRRRRRLRRRRADRRRRRGRRARRRPTAGLGGRPRVGGHPDPHRPDPRGAGRPRAGGPARQAAAGRWAWSRCSRCSRAAGCSPAPG